MTNLANAILIHTEPPINKRALTLYYTGGMLIRPFLEWVSDQVIEFLRDTSVRLPLLP